MDPPPPPAESSTPPQQQPPKEDSSSSFSLAVPAVALTAAAAPPDGPPTAAVPPPAVSAVSSVPMDTTETPVAVPTTTADAKPTEAPVERMQVDVPPPAATAAAPPLSTAATTNPPVSAWKPEPPSSTVTNTAPPKDSSLYTAPPVNTNNNTTHGGMAVRPPPVEYHPPSMAVPPPSLQQQQQLPPPQQQQPLYPPPPPPRSVLPAAPPAMTMGQQHPQLQHQQQHQAPPQHQQQQQYPQQHQAPPPQQQQHQPPPPPQQQQPQHPQQAPPQQQQQQQPLPLPPGPPQQPAPQAGGLRELRVEDALLYLDDVKHEFRDRPAIYNEFLAIMKHFKTQEVDTPGVINRVSRLFRGYNNLILGFNTFLPEGYKIRLEDLVRQDAERAAHEEQVRRNVAAAAAAPVQPARKPVPKKPKKPIKPAAAKKKQKQPQAPPQQQPPQQQQQPPQQQQAPQQQQQPPQQHQAVEFDHAISYVTKIKRRFANDPSIYHQFLEILHNYQREQRGIKEVLEQVAHLFQDHPDLLKEFTFFLPDAVQEQAKERLHRAAAESESRIAAAQQQQQQSMDQPQLIDMTHSGKQGKRAAAAPKQAQQPAPYAQPQQQRRTPAVLEQPENYVYNSAVERQFFDATKEALTAYSRDGGQAWAEFLKCLDMYAQEILSRTEMLNFVEPLLGKRHTKLFEEFKRILASAGNPNNGLPPSEESWYSVPLSEIDFSRCRRCTTSYRALPRDYPAHPCNGRSPQEAKIINDVWVSLPVGSEESYTFRHMRRNAYEENLFRVEDERFEIDMAIDSNAAALQRLLPIAEEIALLAASQEDKRFQYSFDPTILGVVHRNSIRRIYGDSGPEMLELLVKNPSAAVPLVVERLRQKDREWCKVRDRLNQHWRELAEQNYYKSLDHRGLTWRTIDKRATSTRTMIAEIKDRAAHGGKEGAEALKIKLDKAKEEHGTFYEVTKKCALSKNLDLTFLPKPDRRIFTPHLSLMYHNNSWVQRDAYRLLAFALERGPVSPADKERCHRLWVDFLGPWFDLSLNWMQKPAAAYQESTATSIAAAAQSKVASEDDDGDESMDEHDAAIGGRVVTEEVREPDVTKVKGHEFTDHHPLPAETQVSTLYGDGKIAGFRPAENMYVIKFAFGATGYVRPATVLCSILPVEKSAYTRRLRENDPSKLARPGDQLAFGTQSLYLFFRLHQILVERLNTAKRLAFSVDNDRSLVTLVEHMPNATHGVNGRRRYEAYLSLVYALLDGGVGGATEGGKYEDRVRSLLGHGGYELATMDKLIAHIWKNLQALAGDETMWNLVQLYRRHLEAGTFQPEAFRHEAAYLSEGEPMYAFQHCHVHEKDESVLYMEFVGVMDDSDEDMEREVVEPVSKRPRR